MKPKIKILDIFYGGRCQLACAQCDTRSDTIRKGEFDPTVESIKEGILLAKNNFDIEIFSLLGGEPLLYKDKIKDILEFIRSIDKETLIFLPTNGELIGKNIDFLSEILPNYKILLMVSDHFKLFENQKRSLEIKKSINILAQNINLNIIDNNVFWTEIMYQRPNDDGWKNYWEEVKNYKDVNYSAKDNKVLSSTDNTLWWNEKYGIFLHDQTSHLQHYYYRETKPKPFNSVDINKSYFGNCPSCYCTFMLDKKLYKCAALGTLTQFLNKHQSLDDPDWAKFLSYKNLDLTKCTDEDIENFSVSKYKPITECSMCPSNSNEIFLKEETVLPIKIYKK
jgi:organic radical activating enzyme